MVTRPIPPCDVAHAAERIIKAPADPYAVIAAVAEVHAELMEAFYQQATVGSVPKVLVVLTDPQPNATYVTGQVGWDLPAHPRPLTEVLAEAFDEVPAVFDTSEIDESQMLKVDVLAPITQAERLDTEGTLTQDQIVETYRRANAAHGRVLDITHTNHPLPGHEITVVEEGDEALWRRCTDYPIDYDRDRYRDEDPIGADLGQEDEHGHRPVEDPIDEVPC